VVLDGPLYLTRAQIEPMVENRYGRILFFCGEGSISASGSGRTHLSAAKMGLIGVARGLASAEVSRPDAPTGLAREALEEFHVVGAFRRLADQFVEALGVGSD
jgi:hypothetical protein